VKFTSAGFIKINLDLADGTNEPPTYRFTVIDSGVGIPSEKQGDIFSEFETLDASYSRKFGGTGLGLAICKSLISAMGGRIGIISEEDRGATFWFEVALQKGQDRKILKDDDDDDLPGTSAIAGVHILVAEDIITNQLIITAMLERMGCDVDVVSGGAEAVQSIMQCPYDAVLMDVSMPEMDGLEATKVVRASGDESASVPIIGVTAYAFDEDREKILAAGMDELISKPISRAALYQALCTQIGRRRAQSEQRNLASSDGIAGLDLEVLQSVLASLTPDAVDIALDRLRSDIEKHTLLQNAAAKDKNPKAFERATHAISGVAGVFGARELEALAGRANALIRESQNDRAFELSSDVTDASQRFLKAVALSTDALIRKAGDAQEEKRRNE
jgi:CheY-like chemotaxis protein